MIVQNLSNQQYIDITPREFRQIVRRGEYTGDTQSVCRGYARTAMAIVPQEYAFDFFLFAHRYPGVVPIIEVTEPGSPHPKKLAPDADLRTDLTSYHVFIKGNLETETHNIKAYWRDDSVAFLIGCSRGLDAVLQTAGINYRFLGVFSTNIYASAGRIRGGIRVTCRLIKGNQDAIRTIQIASRYPAYHGTPLHIGDPSGIGIKDLYHPDIISFGDTIAPVEPDELAMFWGCGMSLKSLAADSKLPLMITDGNGAMFVTDRLNEELASLS